jgi:hypothetical protein
MRGGNNNRFSRLCLAQQSGDRIRVGTQVIAQQQHFCVLAGFHRRHQFYANNTRYAKAVQPKTAGSASRLPRKTLIQVPTPSQAPHPRRS